MALRKFPDVGDLWTHKHIQILKQWKAKAFVQLWLHDNSAYYYMFINIWVSYPIIVISAACSATVLVNDSGIVRLIVGVLSLLNAILTAVNKQLCPGAYMQEHLLMSKRYNNLIRNVDTCLCLTETMRPHPSVFIERVGMEIDNLADNTLNPPGYVVGKFESIFGTLDRMLYGENVFELLKLEMQTTNMVNNVRRRSEMMRNQPVQQDTPPDIETGACDTETNCDSFADRAITMKRSVDLPIPSMFIPMDKSVETAAGTIFGSPERTSEVMITKDDADPMTKKPQIQSAGGDRPINICPSIDTTANVWNLKSLMSAELANSTGVVGATGGDIALRNTSNTNNFSIPAKSPMRSPFREIKSLLRSNEGKNEEV